MKADAEELRKISDQIVTDLFTDQRTYDDALPQGEDEGEERTSVAQKLTREASAQATERCSALSMRNGYKYLVTVMQL